MKNIRLSYNFWLSEFTKSQTAQRVGGDLLKRQNSPSETIISNLEHHCKTALQPIRNKFGTPILINSGFRHKTLNTLIGGTEYSDHCKGDASDIEATSDLLKTKHAESIKEYCVNEFGFALGPNCTPNYLLFLSACLLMKQGKEIQQIIHEFGTDGEPAWVHIATKKRPVKHEILIARKEKKSNGAIKTVYEALTLAEAFELGRK